MTEWGDTQSAGYRYYSSSAARPSVTTYQSLSEGTQGTLQTLGAMRDAVTIGLPPEYVSYKDGSNAVAAARITSYSPDTSKHQLAAAIYQFARDQVSYIDHPWNMQVVQDAKRTLQLRTGDCVSKSVLVSTLLASLGIKSRFVAQATTIEGFDHVYVEAQLEDGSWLALDPTADGKDGRPAGHVGWSQRLADGGFEMAYEIF
ncbi:MAG: transglutaminase domain-containing protein [Blastocatellia bacterium]|nr:transglutaminase domain-containing protein [Blastocatellia bacterium]